MTDNSAKDFCPELYKNLINGVVTETRSEQMDTCGLHIRHSSVLCKECLEIDLHTGIKITFHILSTFVSLKENISFMSCFLMFLTHFMLSCNYHSPAYIQK